MATRSTETGTARMLRQDHRWVRDQIDRINAEEKLVRFMAAMWHVIEPSHPFMRGWALDAMCDHLEAVTAGHIRKLVITVPPGFAKSLTTGVFWPAWEWGPKRRPAERHLCASYVESLPIRDNTKCRRLIESDAYQERWGQRFRLSGDQNQKTKFENDKTGWKQTAVVGGATGERGTRTVLDDAHSVKGAESEAKREGTLSWLAEAWFSRVDSEETSARLIIGQRTHERDATGLVLASDLGYEHLCIPMEWREGHPFISYNWRPTAIGWTDPRTEHGELAFPERFNRESTEQIKKGMRAWGGTYAESAQLDQVPTPRGGGMFRKDWFRLVSPVEVPQDGIVVRGWDLAASTGQTSAYTACVRMRLSAGRIYVEDARRIRGTPREVEQLIRLCAEQDGKDVLQDLPQDPGQAGKSQKAYLAQALHGFRFRFSPESGDKSNRASPFAAQCEAGNVSLVTGTWNAAYVNEHSSFPVGAFKDQVDASSRAYAALLRAPPAEDVPQAPEVIAIGAGSPWG